MTTQHSLKLPDPLYKVKLVNDDTGRYYSVEADGRNYRFEGVTSILNHIPKPWLGPWMKKAALENVRKKLLSYGSDPVILEPDLIEEIIKAGKAEPDKIKDTAGDFGTRAHKIFNDLIIARNTAGAVVHIPDEFMDCVAGFNDWLNKTGIEVVAGEVPIANIFHQYGGSLDAVGVRDGLCGILDWKTSNQFSTSFALQVAAYGVGLFHTYKIMPKWAIIVKFDKEKPKYEIKEVKDLDVAFVAFLRVKEMKEALELEHYL